MAKKILIITAIVILFFIIVGLILFNSFNYLKLKSDCINHNTIQNEYSFTIGFDQNTSDAEIIKFGETVKNMTNIKNVEFISKNKKYQELLRENSDNSEMMNQLDEIGFNPLSSSIKIYSNISNANVFLELENNILKMTENHGLKIGSHNDGKLKLIQEQLIKVNNASLTMDLLKFIFTSDKNKFFVDNYSFICNPDFKNSFLFSN